MGKVLEEQNSKDNSTRYSLIESEIQFDGKNILTYGIKIESLSSEESFGEENKSEILDITTQYDKAIILFKKVVELEITPKILKDVTEDFIIS